METQSSPLSAIGQDLAANPPAAGTGRASITLARHGEPALSRKIRLAPQDYFHWWAKYEESSLLAGQTPPLDLIKVAQDAAIIIASTRPRSIETAQAVSEGRSFCSDPLFIEAPLPPPPFPAFVRFSPRHWGFLARFWWWFFDNHAGQESRAEATLRAEEAARQLTELADQGRSVLVLAHGFFNTMIGLELKRLGWRLVKDQGYNYWAQKRFERR